MRSKRSVKAVALGVAAFLRWGLKLCMAWCKKYGQRRSPSSFFTENEDSIFWAPLFIQVKLHRGYPNLWFDVVNQTVRFLSWHIQPVHPGCWRRAVGKDLRPGVQLRQGIYHCLLFKDNIFSIKCDWRSGTPIHCNPRWTQSQGCY